MRVLLALSCVLVTLAVVEARPQTGVFGFFSNLGDEISDVGDVVVDGVSDYASSVGETVRDVYNTAYDSSLAVGVRDTVDDVQDTIGCFYYIIGDCITG